MMFLPLIFMFIDLIYARSRCHPFNEKIEYYQIKNRRRWALARPKTDGGTKPVILARITYQLCTDDGYLGNFRFGSGL